MDPSAMMSRCMEMMEKRGVSPGAVRRWRILMGARTFLDGPGALLGRAEELGLSQEQRERLETLLRSARNSAREVLTPEQTERLGDLPDSPQSLKEVCREMASKMGPMGSGMPDMGEMMKRMMGGGGPNGPAPGPDTPQGG